MHSFGQLIGQCVGYEKPSLYVKKFRRSGWYSWAPRVEPDEMFSGCCVTGKLVFSLIDELGARRHEDTTSTRRYHMEVEEDSNRTAGILHSSPARQQTL